MNELFMALGIEAWKPVFGALVLPPVPFIVLILIGARLMFRNRFAAWGLVLSGCAGVWLMCTSGAASMLTHALLAPPRALSASAIGELKHARKTAIVVLGAGRYLLAPEYGVSNLRPLTLERLRYGLWLSRETGLPVAVSGGVGHGGQPGPSEAEISARIAEREFGRPLRWVETQSRDTTENAERSVALLQPDGIERIVLVTHGFHMRRALAAFERAQRRAGTSMTVLAAPMGLDAAGRLGVGDWLPSIGGFERSSIALHEWLGRLGGA